LENSGQIFVVDEIFDGHQVKIGATRQGLHGLIRYRDGGLVVDLKVVLSAMLPNLGSES
jgi:hypothetical protein